jgi:hypothetical protein
VLRVFEEFGHLFQIGHSFSGATNVFESHPGLLAVNHPRLAFAEGEDIGCANENAADQPPPVSDVLNSL